MDRAVHTKCIRASTQERPPSKHLRLSMFMDIRRTSRSTRRTWDILLMGRLVPTDRLTALGRAVTPFPLGSKWDGPGRRGNTLHRFRTAAGLR